MQYEKNNNVLFKVALVSLLIIMIAIAAAIYYTSEKAIAQVPVPYPYNLYPFLLQIKS
jgi:hypothetical protein